MPNKTPDRRTAKTIAALRTALIELIIEKHYDSITVQDIIDRANVGRSTFYSHFRDKEDLLVGDWKRFFQLIADNTNLGTGPDENVAPIEGMFSHLKHMHALYRALVRSSKTDRLFSVGSEYLAQKLEEKIMASFDPGKLSVPPEFLAHYLSLQIFGTLKWWLDRDMCYSPHEMGQMFQTLVRPSVTAARGSDAPPQ
jgi:AcrR family transcriptional regulator